MQSNTLAKILPIVIVVFFAFIGGKGLLHPGLPPTHDGEYHVIRFYEFDKVLRSGNFYPRWAPDLNNGYGVPLFTYVYPLPNYIASFIHAFGISFIDAFKLNMLVALILAGVFMYLWAGSIWGRLGGVIASVFYSFAPYHLLDIYIRGSVGEVWALAFFPAFLWAVTKFVSEKQKHFLSIASIFLALIIFSHNILALMFFPFAISYVGFLVWKGSKGDRRVIWGSTFPFLLGIGLSSIFWLPALLERQYVRGLEVFDYSQHFVEVYQLLIPSWGSGFSADVSTEGLSFQIGIANLVALLVCLVLVIRKNDGKRDIRDKRILIFMLAWVLIAVALMHKVSSPLWVAVPLIQYFQFPWRFLSLVILCLSFLAGSIAQMRLGRVFGFAFIFLPVLLGIGYTVPAYYHLRDDSHYLTRPNFIDGTNSPGDTFNTVWFNTKLSKASVPFEETREFTRVNTAYFPGWKVLVDGKEVAIQADKDGLIQIEKPGEGASLELRFTDTAIQQAGKTISALSFFILLALLLKNTRVRMRPIV